MIFTFNYKIKNHLAIISFNKSYSFYGFTLNFVSIFLLIQIFPSFSDPDRSLNRKRERFKVFEVEPRSNRS